MSTEYMDTTQSHLILGDCVKSMRNIPDDSVDCIITDPPYNLGLFMHNRNTNLKKMRENQFAYAGWDNMEYQVWKRCMGKFMEQCARVCKKSASLVVFMSVLKVADIVSLAQKYGFYYKLPLFFRCWLLFIYIYVYFITLKYF